MFKYCGEGMQDHTASITVSIKQVLFKVAFKSFNTFIQFSRCLDPKVYTFSYSRVCVPTLSLLCWPNWLYERQPAVSACEGNLALKAGEVCGAHLRTGSSVILTCPISVAGHQKLYFSDQLKHWPQNI